METNRLAASLDVRDILAIIRKRIWVIVLPLILVAAISVGGTYLITPEYESSAIIQIDPQVRLIGEVQMLVGQQNRYRTPSNYERRNQLSSYYNEITSSRYTAILSEQLHLDRLPQLEQKAQERVALQPNLAIEVARVSVLQEKLKETVSLSWASGDQIRITSHSTDPLQARDITNTLGDIFISEKIKQELNQIRSSQDFSDIQLEKYERQLEDQANRRTALEREIFAIRIDEEIASETNRSEISAEVRRATQDIQDYRSREKEIVAELAGIEGLATSHLDLVTSTARSDKQRELKEQLRQISDMAEKYTWSDPQIVNFKVRQNSLLNTIERENRRLVGEQYGQFDEPTQNLLTELFNLRTHLDYLYSKKPYVQSARDDLNARLNLLPEYQSRLDQLDREIAATTDLRDRFKMQQESATISQAMVQDMSSSKYRIVEPAKLSPTPYKPNRKKIGLMGILLGFVIGGAAALLVELLDNSFKKVEDVEATLGLPVLGVTPRAPFLKKMSR